MLGFLHTAQVHVETFERLVREQDSAIVVRHSVAPELLASARDSGLDAVRAGVKQRVNELVDSGSRIVVCTCSTLGAAAEAVAVPDAVRVMRVDRAMAELAIQSGRRILVVAALETTVQPTLALLQQIAEDSERSPVVHVLRCPQAWPLFEAGNVSAYTREIARVIEHSAASDDIVLLAQASMAPAATLVEHLAIPILSSPRLGVAAALAHIRSSEGLSPAQHAKA